jgi:hypothetical protein
VSREIASRLTHILLRDANGENGAAYALRLLGTVAAQQDPPLWKPNGM